MKRRSFLKGLAGVIAAPVIPKLPVTVPEAAAEVVEAEATGGLVSSRHIGRYMEIHWEFCDDGDFLHTEIYRASGPSKDIVSLGNVPPGVYNVKVREVSLVQSDAWTPSISKGAKRLREILRPVDVSSEDRSVGKLPIKNLPIFESDYQKVEIKSVLHLDESDYNWTVCDEDAEVAEVEETDVDPFDN